MHVIHNFKWTGNVHIPNKSSETYRSMVGLLDGRVDFDPKIQLGHVNYEASLSWMASKLSYENSAYIKTIVENRWKVFFFSFILVFCNGSVLVYLLYTIF